MHVARMDLRLQKEVLAATKEVLEAFETLVLHPSYQTTINNIIVAIVYTCKGCQIKEGDVCTVTNDITKGVNST